MSLAFAPAIPFLQIPDLVLIPQRFFGSFPHHPLLVKPFAILIALSCQVGISLTKIQAKRLGINERAAGSFALYIVVIGFFVGHMFDVLFYHPDQIPNDPLCLLRSWESLSSVGGMIGGTIGGFIWKWRYKIPRVLPYGEAAVSGVPMAWVIGRAACAVAHDHPGIPSNLWFAVRYPDSGRLDLGLLEMVLLIPLAVAFLWLRRKPRPWGFFCSWICICYAPVRFVLDFLRAPDVGFDSTGLERSGDMRYLGLTPAQWVCLVMLGGGLVLLRHTLRIAKRPLAFALPKATPELLEADLE